MKTKQKTYQNLVIDYDDFVNYIKRVESVERVPKLRRKAKRQKPTETLKSTYLRKLEENFHLYFVVGKSFPAFQWEFGERYKDRFIQRDGKNSWAGVLSHLRSKMDASNFNSTLFLCADKERIAELNRLQLATCQLPVSEREISPFATYHSDDLSSVFQYKKSLEEIFSNEEEQKNYKYLLGTATAIRAWHHDTPSGKIKHLYVTPQQGRDFRSMVIRHSSPSEQVLAVSFEQEDLALAKAYQLDTCFLNKGANDQIDHSFTYEKKISIHKRKRLLTK